MKTPAAKGISATKQKETVMKNDFSQSDRDRFLKKVDKSGECWLWTASKFPNGYGQFQFKGRPHGAHRISFMMFKGEIPPDLLICHTCDNPQCVNPDHLFAGTPGDNMTDKRDKGRAYTPPGEANGAAVLTPEIVREIREHQGTTRQIADQYNISIRHVQQIKSRRRWKHLD